MDIFIKSFNRPYYLERCIISIIDNVEGSYIITVMDDGTPNKYLDKLKSKYPEIRIITSQSHVQKVKAVEDNILEAKDINGFNIPTNLWIDTIKKSSEYCVVTEDDVWFTHGINVDLLSEVAKKNNINLIKLGWLGNFKDDRYVEKFKINKQLIGLKPLKMFTGPKWLMDLFFYNKYKFFSIAYKLGIFDNYTKRKYWVLNSILMGFWKKDYWLEVWKDAKGKVDEKQQLRNAATYYHKQKHNPNFVVRLNQEVMKTTFQSSATNSYHEYGCKFDVNYFNYLMNEAWYNDEFNSMQNYPNDFTIEYFESFFDDRIDKKEFRNWVEQFKNQYRNLGCQIH